MAEGLRDPPEGLEGMEGEATERNVNESYLDEASIGFDGVEIIDFDDESIGKIKGTKDLNFPRNEQISSPVETVEHEEIDD